VYWGLFDSRAAAQHAVATLPARLRSGGPAALAVSQILR
jgi:septal ring-binding cell division protein DamX